MCDTLPTLIIQVFFGFFNRLLVKFWLFHAHTFGTFALSGAVVNVKKHTFELAVAGFEVKSCGQLGFEFVDDDIGLYAQNRMYRAGHADVGDIARSVRQHLSVGGLNMGVGAEHRTNFSVEIITHKLLFGSSFRMEIKNKRVSKNMVVQEGKAFVGDTLCAQAEWMCLVGKGN